MKKITATFLALLIVFVCMFALFMGVTYDKNKQNKVIAELGDVPLEVIEKSIVKMPTLSQQYKQYYLVTINDDNTLSITEIKNNSYIIISNK